MVRLRVYTKVELHNNGYQLRRKENKTHHFLTLNDNGIFTIQHFSDENRYFCLKNVILNFIKKMLQIKNVKKIRNCAI